MIAQLMTSPYTSVGVNTRITYEVDCKVKIMLANFSMDNLEGIIFFPKILYPEHSMGAKSTFAYKRASRFFYIGSLIDFEAWDTADLENRKQILIDFYSDALEKIPSKYINSEEKTVIKKAYISSIESITSLTPEPMPSYRETKRSVELEHAVIEGLSKRSLDAMK